MGKGKPLTVRELYLHLHAMAYNGKGKPKMDFPVWDAKENRIF